MYTSIISSKEFDSFRDTVYYNSYLSLISFLIRKVQRWPIILEQMMMNQTNHLWTDLDQEEKRYCKYLDRLKRKLAAFN